APAGERSTGGCSFWDGGEHHAPLRHPRVGVDTDGPQRGIPAGDRPHLGDGLTQTGDASNAALIQQRALLTGRWPEALHPQPQAASWGWKAQQAHRESQPDTFGARERLTEDDLLIPASS